MNAFLNVVVQSETFFSCFTSCAALFLPILSTPTRPFLPFHFVLTLSPQSHVVTKVTTGGRRRRYAVTAVVGNGNGAIGYGTGKAEVRFPSPMPSLPSPFCSCFVL